MAKLPRALVALPEVIAIGVPFWTVLGSNPPMMIGGPLPMSPGVTSRMVTQVALPNPVIALRPSMVGLEDVTIGVPSAAVPPVFDESTATEDGKTIGARLMANSPRP